jgi:23S rRNA (adenine2503-C2)-methyltransferase
MSSISDLLATVPSPVAASKTSLLGLTRTGLAEALGVAGVPERERKMRVAQLWHWIYFQGATSFDAMLNVSKVLRGRLAELYTLDRPEVVTEQVSKDGTRKWLMRLAPHPARPHGQRSRLRGRMRLYP